MLCDGAIDSRIEFNHYLFVGVRPQKVVASFFYFFNPPSVARRGKCV